MVTKEFYNAKAMPANSTLQVGTNMAGFLCVTAGTLTVTDADGTVLIDDYPVNPARGFIRIPLLSRTNSGMTVTLEGGASGTIFL